MHNILICDDERDIVSALRLYLEPEGYGIFEANNGREALELLRNQEIHLILLDVMMPELDGIETLSALRREFAMPVILLTAKSESSDKVLGLNVGADDYVTKPFDPTEIIARVRSQMRRYTNLGGMVKSQSRFVIGGIALDDEEKTVSVDGDPIALTPIEYNILRLLMKSPGRVYSSAQIYEKVWGESAFGSEGAVAVHIRHLREKIEITPSEPRYLKVVWGLGYKMEVPVERGGTR
jgi:DNA-binding response OmpR family regulator